MVEDAEAVREAALAMIEELGYRKLEAGAAEQALALLETGERVDLVFTDVVMPGPLRTRDFAQRLRELIGPACPCCSRPATPTTRSSIRAGSMRACT